MTHPLAIANFFISKALATNQELTPMKLVKLVYISHGWYLALTGEPLISEEVQAWKYGPVVNSIYHIFKKYGNSQVSFLEPDESGNTPLVTDPAQSQFLEKIWQVYGNFNALRLSALTHQKNTPWDIIYNQKGGKNYNSTTIPNDLIQQHYKEKANAQPQPA